MQGPPSVAVLGFRPHTYWTAVVALAGPREAPQVLERRRLLFAEGEERFVFHQAAELERSQAAALVETVRASTRANAARAIAQLVQDLAGAGIAVRAAVVPTGRQTPPDDLETIVRSHALMHAAEGSFYRDVVAEGCAELGLEVARPPEPGLAEMARTASGAAQAALDERLKAMGAALGPPWSEDQKLATLAAWTRL
jgi:hypothetical protein